MTVLAHNYFLRTLPAESRTLMEPHLHPEEMKRGASLFVVGEPVRKIYFPTCGIISLTIPFADGRIGEFGVAGLNSVVGGVAALRDPEAIYTATVQANGETYAIPTSELARCMGLDDGLRAHVKKHEHSLAAQTYQIAGCNAVHTLQQRLCRWLLQSRDLLVSPKMTMTQEFVAGMLGVQRPTLTVVIRDLQRIGLVNARRGEIELLDTDGIAKLSCECYSVIRARERHFTGWLPEFEPYFGEQ